MKRQPAPRVSWLFQVLLIAAAALAIRFVIVYAMPYWSFNRQVFDDSFWQRRYGLLMHLSGGIVAILTGVVQLWLGETRRALRWHRRLGMAYVAGVTVGSAGGFYLSLTTPNVGWVYSSGLFGLACAWTLTTGMAYLAIRRRLIEQHREWMIRSYVVTLAFVFYRLFTEVAAQMHLGTDNERSTAAAWLCWGVPLMLAEPLIQLRKFRPKSRHAEA